MNLPKKDRYGNSYLSYSQISLFKRDLKEYHSIYIDGRPFEGNEYTDFGSKVGEGIEGNDFSKFSNEEKETLKKVTRLDEFEKKVYLKYDGFYLLGFIDTNSFDYDRIIDYKTGGKKKEFQYSENDYTQLQLYALSIRQEFRVTPTKASVEFIRREGNAYRGEKLTVANEAPLKIDVDISEERLKQVYWDTLKTAKEISLYYEKVK